MNWGKLLVEIERDTVTVKGTKTTITNTFYSESDAQKYYDRITAYLSEMIETELEEHAQKAAQELINGTGTGTPTGILNSIGGD
jgi:Na+/phosphate symporter